ncbi:MAG: hypothetical protein RDV41_00305 [Planctomycetota bacterium]|nr:hypothetical protein [Planctomycetota bacterium]
MKVKQWRFTTVSAIEFGAAILLGLIALGIGWSAYLDTRLYFNFRTGMRNFGSREWGKALEKFDNAIRFRPSYRYSHEFQAMINTYQDQLDLAEQTYTEYLERFRNPVPARIGLAVVAMKRYDATKNRDYLKTAVEHLEAAKAMDSKCAEVPICFAHIALLEGKMEDARRCLDEVDRDKLLPTLDGMVDYHIARGVIAYAKGTPDAGATASREFRRAWHLAPERIIPLANFTYMQGKTLSEGKLIDEFEEQRLNMMAEDIKYTYEMDMERNIALRGALYSFWIGWGLNHYNSRRDVRLASDRLDHAYMLDPKRPDAVLWKASLHMKESKIQDVRDDKRKEHMHEAFKYFHSVTEGQVSKQWVPDITPELMSTCLNNEAVLTVRTAWDVDRGPDSMSLKEASKKLQEALKSAPNDHLLLRNLAVVFDKQRDSENAIFYYRKSLSVKPEQPDLEQRIEELQLPPETPPEEPPK